MTSRSSTLADLGEDTILFENIEPLMGQQRAAIGSEIVVGLGDDAAVLALNTGDKCIVVTTDPCPTPTLCMVEPAARDLVHYGWLTVIINLSDLAAMGADPIAMVVSTVMPERLRKDAYDRFIVGLMEASAEWACPILGGNIKDGPAFTANATAVGQVARDRVLTRDGARPGDVVCVIGQMGLFWAALLSKLKNIPLEESDAERAKAALWRPIPRLHEAAILAKSGAVTSCMDSSDGVITCIQELALRSTAARISRGESPVGITLNSFRFTPAPSVRKLGDATGIDPLLLMLSWGGWELVCTVDPTGYQRLIHSLEALKRPPAVTQVGTVVEAQDGALLEVNGKHIDLARLKIGSKRFRQTSIFSHGLAPFVKRLQEATNILRS